MIRKSKRNQNSRAVRGETYEPVSTKELVVDSLKLPKDLLLGASIVTHTGNPEAWIENYKGITEYCDTFVLLQGKTCHICISGKGLSIDYYTNEDMKISGCIECVKYE